MYKKLAILIVAIFIFISHYTYSQTADISFEHITMDDGLSQSSVNCIMQDSSGYIWMGTQGGLNKYNGSSSHPFDIYLHNIYDTNSLSSSWIYAIDEDAFGNVWVGTVDGLNKIERKSGKCIRYLHDPDDQNTIRGDRVFSVLVDSKGNIWAVTTGELNKLDPSTGKFSHYEPYYDYMSDHDNIYNLPMIEDSKGNIWVGTKDGLNLFDSDYEQFNRISTKNSGLSNNYVHAIFEDKEGNLWIGTSNGLNKYNSKTRQVKTYFRDKLNPNSLSDNDIRSIVQDQNGFLWIGTSNGGLCRMDINNELFTSYLPNIDDPSSISHRTIISLCIDKSNVLWVGTYGGALNKIDLKRKKFKLYTQFNSKINDNEIAGLFVDDDSKLWVGLWGTGLNIIDRKTGEIEYISTKSPANRRLLNDFVHVIYKDNRGLVWIGTREGLNIYDKENNEFYTLDKFFGPNNLNNRVHSICEDKYNNFWVGTDQGLYYLNFEKKEIISYLKNSEDPESLSDSQIYSVCVDEEGFVWIGTGNGGLNKFNPVTGVFKKYKSDVRNSNTISNNSVYDVFIGSQGYLWIATRSGLNKFNKKDTTFTIYTKINGLPNDLIYNIVEDENDNLWMTTGYGLAMYDRKNNDFRSYDKADGIGSLELNLGSLYKSKTGEIFFGGNAGFNSFHPDQLMDNLIKPDVVFLNYRVTNSSGMFTISLEGVDKIELSYNDYGITVYFATLEYTNPRKNRYQYKVDELNEDWFDLGNTNFRTFSNLPPGEYTLRVKGSNNDYVWNEKDAVLKIVVKPPFWRTIYAYIFYVLFVFFVVYYIFKFRTRKLRNANQALRIKQMAALEIAKQKEELSIKNKNITDSINYAKRIQEAMMPSEYLFKKLLTQSFILYKPKDIVSGDFYWIAEKNNKIFIAAVDCTGHGVPGAFMSIIGFDLLRNITKDQGIENPAQILNQLNNGVIETFSKHSESQEVKDGMDVSLCVINKNQKQIEYSGAMNPLYIIRNNKVIEIKGNRFSVGTIGFGQMSEKFENHIIPYNDGDMVYIFSDGYQDQFGGPLGKKFKFRRFRHLLLTINNLPIPKQKAFLDENIESWRGELEQVDDILIIGMRL
ncbi:MAG: two-component regulator propeller domain-containing protein [Bacteroidota bacterium]